MTFPWRNRFAACSALISVAGSIALAAPALADFGFTSFGVTYTDSGGVPVTQAGSHPFAQTTTFRLDSSDHPAGGPNEALRDLVQPQLTGLVGDATAVPTCSAADFSTLGADVTSCPKSTVVGVAGLAQSSEDPTPVMQNIQVFNLEPSPGMVAKLGFVLIGAPVVIALTVSPDPPYNVVARALGATQAVRVYGLDITLWGDPADPAHDAQRGAPFVGPNKPFLTLPRACTGPLSTDYAIDSWDHPAAFLGDGRPDLSDPHWITGSAPFSGATGCGALAFDPSASIQPTSTKQASPTGLDVSIDVNDPGLTNPNGTAESDLKKAVVTLPEGLDVNSSSVDGLGACSPAQLAKETATSEPGAGCPLNAKIASASVTSPLLAEKLSGSLFLATPHDNPFNSLLAGYLVIRSAERGIIVKLPGKIDTDPVTGRLTASFDQNPQLPFSHFEVRFPDGPRSSLATPRACGDNAISAALDGWSGASVVSTSTFRISGDGAGGPCAPPQFAPSLEAGLSDPTAGGSSSFALRVQRTDLDNELKTIKTTMPPGLLARVAGVARCPESDAAAGSCPVGSQIGHVEAGAGVGPNPFYITAGKAYLTDGYNGAPFGLLIQVPAVAGPFDLGMVNIRAALRIDPTTAAVTAEADPAPRILQGIPLQVRDVRVVLDRADFMRAPTSCDPMQIGSEISSYQGDTATPSSRFQVGGCGDLAYAPKLAISLTGKGQTTDDKHPGVHAVLTQPSGQANNKKVAVSLPLSLALDPDNAQSLCEFADGSKVDPTCPKGSIVGTATAKSPILDQPLTGPVYFVKNIRIDAKSGREIRTLPKLVIPLTGENALRLTVTGTSNVVDGQLVTTFDNLPDAPVSDFTLDIDGGKHGILVVSGTDICKSSQVAIRQADGQNGKTADANVYLQTPACSLKIISKKVGKTSVMVKVGGLSAGKVTVSGKGIKKTTKTISQSTVATITAKRTKGKPGKVTVSFDPTGPAKARKTSK